MRKPLLLGALLTLAACGKKDNPATPTIDFGPGDGLTHRDANALPNGQQDPTDWTTDATWNERELALFADLGLNLNGAQQPEGISSFYVYPNPAARFASWSFQTQRNANGSVAVYSLHTVIVDRNYKPLYHHRAANIILSHQMLLDYASLSLRPNETYRAYYVVTNESGFVYKGHGDVRYNQ